MKIFLAGLLCMLTGLIARAQMGFQVEPPKLYFEQTSQPALAPPLRLKITNPNNVKMVIRATCADWRRDSLGQKQFMPPGTTPNSCCPYLRVIPETIDLPPKSTQEVLVSLQPDRPASATLRNGMLMLTQINEQELAAAQGIKSGFIFKVQLGVHLYDTPGDTKQKMASIDTLRTSRNGKTALVDALVANTGTVNLDSELRVELTNLASAEEIKLPGVPVNTKPGDKIKLKVPVPETIPRGRYLVIAILDSGTDVPLQVAEMETDL